MILGYNLQVVVYCNVEIISLDTNNFYLKNSNCVQSYIQNTLKMVMNPEASPNKHN